ncbi:CPBP family intramembrane glutamic endopeptidase [Halohasta litorea]|uniref:Type II CAAX prenyl endopeptidase Rce1 family protein n=1 Tax=Halohasta litorea TaxID=869891 RepID=A0ABD6D490_9EURY|nr:CPBP family intramembrane glutamic endopeptidase [Halohasta litorea]
MDGPPADEQSPRSVSEHVWYLPDTDRVRPTWRVIVPLVVGMTLYLGVSAAAWVPVGFEVQSPVDTATSALLLGGQLAAPIGGLVAVLTIVSRLDRRPTSIGDLVPSKPWLLDFGGGLVIGLVAAVCMVAVPITAGETTMTVEPSGVGVDSVALGAVVLVGLVGSLVATVVFQELLFRRVVITNVVEAVGDRADPRQAVGIGVAASTVCYGGFELLISGVVRGPSIAVPAALLGLYYAAAYVFTGRLGLPIGLHLGGAIALGSLYGTPTGGFHLPSVVVVDTLTLDQSLAVSVRLQLVRVLVGGLLVGLWVYAFYNDFNVEERVFGADSEGL